MRDRSFGTGTYAIEKSPFVTFQYCLGRFVAPYIPPRRFLSSKQLNPGQIPHKGNDFFPRCIRLFAVLLYGADKKLMYARRLPLGFALGRQQTDFRVAARPIAHTVKPGRAFAVTFEPNERHRPIPKAPCADQPQSFGKLRKGQAHKNRAQSFAASSGTGQGAQLVNAHGGIVLFRCALHLAPFIPPRGICVNNAVFLGDGKPPFNVHGIMILPVRRISKG